MLQSVSTDQAGHVSTAPWVSSPAPRKGAIEFIPAAGVEVKITRGKTIFDEGDPATYLYRIVRGSVRLGRVMEEGHRQICDFLLPGDLLGFAAENAYAFFAETIEDCILVRYRKTAMASLMQEDARFASELQRLTASGLNGAYEHMVRLCHRSAKARISWFLLAMAKRTKGNVVHLPMSRCDIADYLGMAHETASRVFTQLKKSGAISEENTNVVRILNKTALAA